MAKYRVVHSKRGAISHMETSLRGADLINEQKLNKGTAFDEKEREKFGLLGKLPERIESLADQVERSYAQFKECPTNLAKNIYLSALLDSNEVLFYRLVQLHLEEMLPITYTPTVGLAVQSYSLEYRRVRGVFISYPNRNRMLEVLRNRFNQDVDLVLVTDGEGVLGIGDQGIGGMNIAISKLQVYTLCAGIHPTRVLPVQLDVGTNNKKLLDDPMYLGWRHARIEGEPYDQFIDDFVQAVRTELPDAYLHWEDFGRENAARNLCRYREKFATFNDDIQGTGATVLACVLAAVKASGCPMKSHRVVVMGAGTAGMGITSQIHDAICDDGPTSEVASRQFWLVDRPGLLFDDMDGLTPEQLPYARPAAERSEWHENHPGDGITLQAVVRQVKPTILIGCSAMAGAFTEQIVKAMAEGVSRPIILPLSNPTSRAEATPEDLINWTDGKVLLATGSPFEPVEYKGRTMRIAQANNAFVFPGLGLGVIIAKAKKVTDRSIRVASDALSECAPVRQDPQDPLLPDLSDIGAVSRKIALAVANDIREQGLTGVDDSVNFQEVLDAYYWRPDYTAIKVVDS